MIHWLAYVAIGGRSAAILCTTLFSNLPGNTAQACTTAVHLVPELGVFPNRLLALVILWALCNARGLGCQSLVPNLALQQSMKLLVLPGYVVCSTCTPERPQLEFECLNMLYGLLMQYCMLHRDFEHHMTLTIHAGMVTVYTHGRVAQCRSGHRKRQLG